eukprot:gene9055-19066_t
MVGVPAAVSGTVVEAAAGAEAEVGDQHQRPHVSAVSAAGCVVALELEAELVQQLHPTYSVM